MIQEDGDNCEYSDMRIAIVGDTGLLGQALVRTFHTDSNRLLGVSAQSPYRALSGLGYEHVEMDLLTQAENFFGAMDSFKPEIVLNAVACVDIQKCEKDPDFAKKINGELPGKFARYAAEKRICFVHISTDAVFDGFKRFPYVEEDLPNPRNQYGLSKLEGERQTLFSNPAALICRTNIVGFRGWENLPTFAEWLCDILSHQKPATLADDFVASSMHVDELGPLILEIVQKGGKGIFHVASHDGVSKYRFGCALARELGLSMDHIKKGTLSELALQPPRAAFIALDVSRAETLLGKKLPDTQSTIQKLARDFKSQLKGTM